MKRKFIMGIATGLFLVGLTGVAYATLITIGTATYTSASNAVNNASLSGTENVYQLIYDTDLQLTWLDYSNDGATWTNQNSWATTIGANINVILAEGWSISESWNSGWRLPHVVNEQYVYGLDGSTTAGYYITTSEMGHLYYDEFSNIGKLNSDGTLNPFPPAPNYFLQNTEDFVNLTGAAYWSDAVYVYDQRFSWSFAMNLGVQGIGTGEGNPYLGLAVRPGEVAYTNPVPEPTTILLFGIGLLGLAGVSRKKKIRRMR